MFEEKQSGTGTTATSRTSGWAAMFSSISRALRFCPPRMTRTFGEVVEASADLWAASPDRSGDPSMTRIHQLVTRLHHTQQRTQWPGPGPADPHLEAIC